MSDSIMFHEGNRRLQDQFESRRISDRLEEFARKEFTPDDRVFIENAPYFFLATADAEGRPDCSFKGGMPGFVAVTGPSELAFPDYDGNGMFKSLGNIWSIRRRPAVHRHAWQAAAPARQRHGDGVPRRSAAGQHGRRTDDRPGHGARDLPELPALHPGHAAGRSSVYAPRAWLRSARASVEGLRRLQGCVHPRQPTFKG